MFMYVCRISHKVVSKWQEMSSGLKTSGKIFICPYSSLTTLYVDIDHSNRPSNRQQLAEMRRRRERVGGGRGDMSLGLKTIDKMFLCPYSYSCNMFLCYKLCTKSNVPTSSGGYNF